MEATPELVMGVNGLTITFMVPLDIPRTSATQTDAELEPVQPVPDANADEEGNRQYVFPNEIAGVITQYFTTSKSWNVTDKSKTTFAVGIIGGAAIVGVVDMRSPYGRCMQVDAYIEANILQGGVVSSDVNIVIDRQLVKKQNYTPQRISVMNNDVLSTELVAKGIATSTSFAFEVSFPETTDAKDAAAQSVLAYLYNGSNANEAHFVHIVHGALPTLVDLPLKGTDTYFMIISNATEGVEGVKMAGLTAQFVEATKYTEFVSLPSTYTIGAFTSTSSTRNYIFFTVDTDCWVFIGGQVLRINANAPVEYKLTPDDFVYDEENGRYLIYIVADRSVTITSNSAGIDYIGVA